MAVLLTIFAVGFVAVGISTIVRLDGALAVRGRFAPLAASRSSALGARARRRYERKASPVLFLLSSVLGLLVVAALV